MSSHSIFIKVIPATAKWDLEHQILCIQYMRQFCSSELIKQNNFAGHVVSQAFYDRKGQKMEGERKTAKNVRDEMSRGRVMDEILVREPATGKLRGPFFPVCLFLSGLVFSHLIVVGFAFFWHRRRG